jgi:hypothetical protein
MAATTIDIGDIVRLRATFVSTDYTTTADPSTVFFNVLYPDNSVGCWSFNTAGGSVVRAATGAYFKDLTASVYGIHPFKALGTGGVQAVDESYFEVRHSRFVL